MSEREGGEREKKKKKEKKLKTKNYSSCSCSVSNLVVYLVGYSSIATLPKVESNSKADNGSNDQHHYTNQCHGT